MVSANNLFILFSFFSCFALNFLWTHFVSFNNNAVYTTISTPAFSPQINEEKTFFHNSQCLPQLFARFEFTHITLQQARQMRQRKIGQPIVRNYQCNSFDRYEKKKENFTLNAHFSTFFSLLLSLYLSVFF